MEHPVYLAVPAGPLRDACLAAFEEPPTLTSSGELGTGEATAPGVVLLAPGQLSVKEFVALAERLYETASGWRFALVRDGDPPAVQVLSLGHPEELEAVAGGARDPGESPGVLMELRDLLRQVSRARHDINNPLTSAMAEVQLLLMDVEEEGEVREGLEVIQEQLRRIRDLVAATGHIRPPRPS